ncbi:hypothetical protein DFH09DRAFT_1173900 [Mycena vulgaris]|nr:hypothetical protein DFH09DRAFT_1173900 [Mycena vulgaris]
MHWNKDDNMAETSSAGSSTPSTSSSDLPSSPFSGSSWPTFRKHTSKDVLQSVLTLRKTWKTLRGGETIWPLELEAALLEGLEKYQPDDSRETRMLGRFPRRNRFISDYIFDKTGKRRSTKQVGSRLQQLRESCAGKQLLHLLSPFREPAYPDSANSALSSPVSLLENSLFPSTSSRHTIMYIDILPAGSPDEIQTTTHPSPWSDAGHVVRASDHPRSLGSINPTVSFTSRSPIVAHSRFTVYSEEFILHAETVPLQLVPQHVPEDADFLYSTQLVPKYWKVILDSPDPTRFTIFQEVVTEDNPFIVFSATYKFNYPIRHFPDYSSGSHKSRLALGPGHIPVCDELASVSDPRYVFDPSTWNPALQYSRERSPMQKYHSSGSDSSSLWFSVDLSNYVS